MALACQILAERLSYQGNHPDETLDLDRQALYNAVALLKRLSKQDLRPMRNFSALRYVIEMKDSERTQHSRCALALEEVADEKDVTLVHSTGFADLVGLHDANTTLGNSTASKGAYRNTIWGVTARIVVRVAT
jgi:hypothetical protein